MMEISLTDLPDMISIMFLGLVLLMMVTGVDTPVYVSSGVLATMLAELVGFWANRQATRLSEVEKRAVQVLKEKGREAGYDDFERLLDPLVGNYNVSELLRSLRDKKVIKEFRRNGARKVALRFRARVL
jgi:hypothetical protein